MKQTVFLLFLTIALAAGSCRGDNDPRDSKENYPEPIVEINTENLVTLSFDIEGMTCTGCETTVENSLEKMDGVLQADASHESGKAVVQFDGTLVTAEAMEQAIELTGYKVTGQSPENN